MGSEDAAIAKLDQAITRLETVLSNLPDQGGSDATRELEGENHRLNEALDAAEKSRQDLAGRVDEVGGRLDAVIGELKSVLEG